MRSPSYYRLVAKFEPGHPKLAGSRTANSRRGQIEVAKRGAWRVLHSYPAAFVADIPIVFATTSPQRLFSSSVRPLRPGALCNPIKLLREVIAAAYLRKAGR